MVMEKEIWKIGKIIEAQKDFTGSIKRQDGDIIQFNKTDLSDTLQERFASRPQRLLGLDVEFVWDQGIKERSMRERVKVLN